MLTQERVKELFKLDRKGRLVRKVTVNNKAKAGDFSTAKDRDGYLVVGIDRKLYRAHRVVWLYVHGQWPNGDIDHINGIKHDNRPSNLRDVTRSENLQNQKVRKNNKVGFKGVWLHKQTGRFAAVIESNGKRYYIGCFETPEEAANAYSEKAKEVHKYNPCSNT